MVCSETQILMLYKKNSAEKQSGPEQEKQSQRDFARNHHPPETAQ